LSTEFEGRRILESTIGAAAGKGRGAIAAKFHAIGILKSALSRFVDELLTPAA
jgi:hypothetical protein